jgi:hypothetical protein
MLYRKGFPRTAWKTLPYGISKDSLKDKDEILLAWDDSRY